ncbi:unnamed protein product [Prunus brigantina]
MCICVFEIHKRTYTLTSKKLPLKFDDSNLRFAIRETIFWKLMIYTNIHTHQHPNNCLLRGERTFLRHRVEARLASLLMEIKEYSEALSLLSGLITEVRRLDDKLLLVDIDLLEKRKLFVFFPCQSTVSVSHRLLSSSSSSLNLNTKLREKAFIARKR